MDASGIIIKTLVIVHKVIFWWFSQYNASASWLNFMYKYMYNTLVKITFCEVLIFEAVTVVICIFHSRTAFMSFCYNFLVHNSITFFICYFELWIVSVAYGVINHLDSRYSVPEPSTWFLKHVWHGWRILFLLKDWLFPL